MQNRLGIVVVGTGFGSVVHLPALQDSEYFRVVGIWGRTLERAKRSAEEFAVPHYGDRLEDLLHLPEVQAVSITTPPFLHYAQAKACLLAGKHVFLEKPVTMHAGEAQELQQLAEERGLVIGVDFEFRCVPHWQYFHDLLRRGEAGQPRLILLEWLVAGRANPHRRWNWYSQKSMGGGALGALASHSFDYLHWLFGEVKLVSAHLSTAIKARPDEEAVMQPVDSDDTCNLVLELGDGTPIYANISTVAYHGAGHWLTVYGDRSTLAIGSGNLKDYVHGFQVFQGMAGAEGLQCLALPESYQFAKTYPDGRIAPVKALLERFVQAILHGKPMIPSIREGIASQRLIDLAHQLADLR